MRPKFGNSSISMRELSKPKFYKDLTRKTNFSEGCSFGTGTSYGLEIIIPVWQKS